MRRFSLRGILSGYSTAHGICKQRGVSTLSPLTTAFNTKLSPKFKFGLKGNKGLFGIPELRTPGGFYELKESVEAQAKNLINESCSPNRSRKIVEVFDELSDTLCKVADLAEFVRLAHPDPSFARAAEEACISISGVVEKLNTNKELFLSLQDVVVKGDKFETSELDKHVASLFLFDFEQCGIHLSEDVRQRVVALNDYILQIGQRFMAGSVNPRYVPTENIPLNIRKWFITEGEEAVVCGLFSEVKEEQVRETAYKSYLLPDAKQEHLLNELLKARHVLANLCGFPTYSHRALKSSLAETPELVKNFLNILNDKLRPKVEQDFKEMRKMKGSQVYCWDVPYLTSRAKQGFIRKSDSEYAPFFSLGACMDGLNMITQELFNITFQNEPIESGEAWANDIHKLAVIHGTEGLLGHIYCDFYERSNKPNQDCHFTIRGGRSLPDGTYQNPIVVVMLNVPSNTSGPSLLSPGMVDNLFHEMGHAMHSMLARTKFQHVTGTRCSTDFAEVPSIFLEYFASDPRVVRRFARHYKTNEPMPEDMVERLCASKHIFDASEMQTQVFYSMLDQVYHSEFSSMGSTCEVLERAQAAYYHLPYVSNTAWHLRFSHLVGYGAKYYSYLMSRAVASWIWQNFFMNDPLSSQNGENYRRNCLAHGGGKPARQLVADFLGVQVTPENLANALISDVELLSSKVHLYK